MPDKWTALRCEACGSPLEPLAGITGIIHLDSAQAVETLANAASSTSACEHECNRLPIIGGDFHVEVIRSPLADLLRCTGCGMLYERAAQPEPACGRHRME